MEKREIKFFWLFLLFSVLTTLNNFLIGYFLIFSVLVISFINKKLKSFFIRLILLCLVLLPFTLPYFSVSREFNYQRSIKDTIHFSLQPEDLVYPGSQTKMEKPLIKLFNLKTESWMKTTPGYLGLSLTILGFLSLYYCLKKMGSKTYGHDILPTIPIKSGELRSSHLRSNNKSYVSNFGDFPKKDESSEKDPSLNLLLTFLLIGLIGFILSFGPALHWGRKTIHWPFMIPLPYAVLYYLLPGFNGFRTPSRFILLWAFAISVIAGFSFTGFSKNWSNRLKIIFVLIFCLLTFWEFNFPLIFSPVPSIKDFPKTFYFLKTLNSKPIIHLPILNWDAYENIKIETERELFSTLTFQPMVNGFSGFTPPEREKLMKEIMLDFPNKKLINWLKTIKVKYVIIHQEDYQQLEAKKFKVNGQKIKSFNVLIKEIENYKKDLIFIKKIDADFIYEVK